MPDDPIVNVPEFEPNATGSQFGGYQDPSVRGGGSGADKFVSTMQKAAATTSEVKKAVDEVAKSIQNFVLKLPSVETRLGRLAEYFERIQKAATGAVDGIKGMSGALTGTSRFGVDTSQVKAQHAASVAGARGNVLPVPYGNRLPVPMAGMGMAAMGNYLPAGGGGGVPGGPYGGGGGGGGWGLVPFAAGAAAGGGGGGGGGDGGGRRWGSRFANVASAALGYGVTSYARTMGDAANMMGFTGSYMANARGDLGTHRDAIRNITTSSRMQGGYFLDRQDMISGANIVTHQLGGRTGMASYLSTLRPDLGYTGGAQAATSLMAPANLNRLYAHGIITNRMQTENPENMLRQVLHYAAGGRDPSAQQISAGYRSGTRMRSNLEYLLGGDQDLVSMALQLGSGKEFDDSVTARLRARSSRTEAEATLYADILGATKTGNDWLERIYDMLGRDPNLKQPVAATIVAGLGGPLATIASHIIGLRAAMEFTGRGAGPGNVADQTSRTSGFFQSMQTRWAGVRAYGSNYLGRASAVGRSGLTAARGFMTSARGMAGTATAGAMTYGSYALGGVTAAGAAWVGLGTAAIAGAGAVAYSTYGAIKYNRQAGRSNTAGGRASELDEIRSDLISRGVWGNAGVRDAFVNLHRVSQSGDSDAYMTALQRLTDTVSSAEVGRGVGDPSTLHTRTHKPSSHVHNLNADFKSRLEAMFAENPELTLTSGARSIEHQQRLWNEALAQYGSAEEARKHVAPPGKSNHNRGLAADIGPRSQYDWIKQNAHRFGLTVPMSWEPWHVEPSGLRSGKEVFDINQAGGPHGGYAIHARGGDGASARGGGFGSVMGDEASSLRAFFSSGSFANAMDAQSFTSGSDYSLERAAAPSPGDGVIDGSMLERAKAIAGFAKKAGFAGRALQTAIAVALAESSGNPNAINQNTNGSTDYGLWQINTVHRGSGFDPSRGFDPHYNAEWAYKISSGGSNWKPWVVYNKGLHTKYLDEASSAIGNGVGDPPTGGVGSSSSSGGSMVLMGSSGAKTVNINVSLSGSAEDARHLARIVAQHLRDEERFQVIGGS